MPHTEELAILVVGELNLEKYKRDIIVTSKFKGLQRISILYPAYMPLQYPLLFPYEERGFQLGIPYHDNKKEETISKGKETQLQCMSFLSIIYILGQINKILIYAMAGCQNK